MVDETGGGCVTTLPCRTVTPCRKTRDNTPHLGTVSGPQASPNLAGNITRRAKKGDFGKTLFETFFVCVFVCLFVLFCFVTFFFIRLVARRFTLPPPGCAENDQLRIRQTACVVSRVA